MMTPYRFVTVFLLLCGLIGAFPGTAATQEAQSVKLGEAALQFAAGSIRETMPQDGIVNLITGDNQTSGNRMILGWGGSDVLYLKLRHPGDASLDDLYTVYRRVRKVFHPATKRYLGYVINRLAVVRVIEVDHSLATVQVVRSFAPLSPGDPVMRFVPPAPEDQAMESQRQMDGEGMIVDLQSDKNMSLVGQWNIVYLDKGRENGLRSGERLEVNRVGSGLPRRKVAEIKILSTEDRTATALITKSISRVLVGDRVQYRSEQVFRGPRSEQPSEETQRLATVDMEPTRASAGADKVDKPVKVVAGAEGARIDLEELAEQLEYDSGEVKVKAPGLLILNKIAEFLRTAAPDKPIRVEGHADSMEIGPSLRSAFPSNWELSRARAAGIVRFLVEQGGLDSAKLSAVGYGATRPVASNATEDGRKRNRRIEIVLLTTDIPDPVKKTEIHPSDSRTVIPPQTGNPLPTADPVSSSAAQAMDHNMAAAPTPDDQPLPSDPDGNPSPSTTVQ
ncbi:MAG TPA: OmpA family protein [Nitrospiraceae bacterium]|nr:OmpA family protein [Nitrospiraceae bacterium]